MSQPTPNSSAIPFFLAIAALTACVVLAGGALTQYAALQATPEEPGTLVTRTAMDPLSSIAPEGGER